MQLQKFFLLAPVFAIAACVTVDKATLPEQVAEQNQYSDFTGTYELTADANSRLGLFDYAAREAGERLALTYVHPLLTATYCFADGRSQLVALDTSSTHTQLRDGRLYYRTPSFKGARMGLGVSKEDHYMYFDLQGDLILVASSSETGLALAVVPFHESRRSVFRFRRVATPPVRDPECRPTEAART